MILSKEKTPSRITRGFEIEIEIDKRRWALWDHPHYVRIKIVDDLAGT
nr:hypothetical protein GTC16762_33690 [Pigmentibacter ruber]